MFLGQPREHWLTVKEMSNDTRARARTDAASQEVFAKADDGLWAYADRMIADRELHPRSEQSDIVSALLMAEIDGKPIERAQVIGIIRLLIAAGHHSTSRAVGICIHYLATHPTLQEELRAHPTLIRPAIEEILRLESPVVAMPRRLTHAVELHGRQLACDEVVMMNWASANRDPETFDHADEFDLSRKSKQHMVFGSGIHLCIGAALARQELQIVLEELLSRTRRFELSAPATYEDIDHHGYAAVPLRLLPTNDAR
jgi:cytochrome P450